MPPPLRFSHLLSFSLVPTASPGGIHSRFVILPLLALALLECSEEALALLQIEMWRSGTAPGLRAAPGDDHLLFEDATEISGSTGGHATSEQSKDQVHGLGQTVMISTPVGSFDGPAMAGLLVRSPWFHTILFLYAP